MATRRCLFCGSQASSREHLWPAWIHERLQITKPIRIAIGRKPVQISTNPQIAVKTVCATCNNGWMSTLEGRCVPLVGSLMQDISIPLDDLQQSLLTVWALKTAMVTDSTNKTSRNLFYTAGEREQLRVNHVIPVRTKVWIGRASKSSLVAMGTDIWIDLPGTPKAAEGSVTTIVVGHLAIQILSIHIPPDHVESEAAITAIQPRPGHWDESLLSVWPVGNRAVTWPPKLTFDTVNYGPLSIATLLDRWRIGRNAI
jgi:hypothetical protein